MKKLLLILLLVGFITGVNGQTFVFEGFDEGTMPPAGWTIDEYAAKWSINNTSNAGGTAPEAMFTYIAQTGTTRLISPAVDLTGQQGVMLEFRHYLNNYIGSAYSIGVATQSGGGAWNTVLETNVIGNIGPELKSIMISNDDVGQSDFRFCFFVSGNLYNLEGYFIDDIWLNNPIDLDAGLLFINTPDFLSQPTEVSALVKNFGSNIITDLEMSYQIDGGNAITTSFTGLDLKFGESQEFVLDGMLNLTIGSYELQVNIVNVNGAPDMFPGNDMLQKDISVISYSVPHRVMLEEFTSSTCGPCATFNLHFVPWCNTHEDEITLVKYQMNWPLSGDPYYTPEGGTRRNQYGVTWVPWTTLDGAHADNMGVIDPMFQNALTDFGLVKVVGSHTLTGTVMDINVNLIPFTNIGNAQVYIVVFEYLTTQNALSNGETEFEHVMMKMVPNALGTPVNLEDRMPVSISEIVNLAGTHVEEWDDLGVAVIVQDLSSLYVYQSDYTVEDANYSTNAQLSEILMDGTLLEGFDPDTYEYIVTLAQGATEVPVITVQTESGDAIAIVLPTDVLPGTTAVEIFAEDGATKLTYTIQFDVDTRIADDAVQAVRIYPNPTNGRVFISGAKNATVTVYNSAGVAMAKYDQLTNGTIDMSRFDNGMYLLNIVIDSQTVLNKKITILK
ncbi:MAG TPA: T9SS type A sorting domain-containing protein [Bacteroidales bacterium]|nr:T9SS type A sorting domain-containing protein [Bacteroidales bacterium]